MSDVLLEPPEMLESLYYLWYLDQQKLMSDRILQMKSKKYLLGWLGTIFRNI